MKVLLPTCFVLCVLLAGIKARHVKSKSNDSQLEDSYGPLVSSDDKMQNDYDYPEETVEPPGENVEKNVAINAEFQTKSQNFTAKVGDTVRLPCEVNNSDVILMWQKRDVRLFQGGVAFSKDYPNIKQDGNYLEVKINSESDFGEYFCKMIRSSEDIPEIMHIIKPPIPPTISSIEAADGKTLYKAGETLKLTCHATGDPKPTISWHKDPKRFDVAGETLIISDLKYRDAGTYRCLADNAVGRPAHSTITINVEHKPVVTIEKFIVNSDREYDAELKCIVHAYPSASIAWKRNNVNVKSNPPKIKLVRHENNVENILIITNLTDADFGQYECSAKNDIGKVEKTISLVRTPALHGIDKPEKMNRDVVLTWKVESKSPITQHELQYRKSGDEQWISLKPEVTKGDKGMYTVKYTLQNLDADKYEIRVRSQNVHGWSDYSDLISLDGVLGKTSHKTHPKKHHKEKNLKADKSTTTDTPLRRQGNDINHSPAATLGGSESSGCIIRWPSLYTISIALLTIFYYKQRVC